MNISINEIGSTSVINVEVEKMLGYEAEDFKKLYSMHLTKARSV